jgi:hypothetical protein
MAGTHKNFSSIKSCYMKLIKRKVGLWLPASIIFIVLFCLLTAFKSPPSPPVSFSFTLGSSLKTSAGVYTAAGVLIKTLWSGVVYSAGTHNGTWDGTTDEGLQAGSGTYHVKVMSSNVSYVWEGTIGNNSVADTGRTVQRGLQRINGMVTVGQYGYYSKGYSEGNPSGLKMKLDTPGKRIQILPTGGSDQMTQFVATDGNKVYWAGFDPYDTSQRFVFATRTGVDTEYIFSTGQPMKMGRGRTYPSIIDSVKDGNGLTSGLAVQPTGNYLFVAHAKLNKLHVLDKTTGALVQALSYTNPRALAADTANRLWMVYTSGGSTRTEKFIVAANGTLTTTGIVLTGLSYPMAMAVTPDNQSVVVADGGTSQQLKAYNNATGAAGWTYGQAGGYSVSALVANDKFYFSDTRDTLTTFLAFQSDGSFWVGDPGNNRAQHFTSGRVFINNVMYVPGFYSCFVDPNNNTRVFSDYLEYRIDYSKPLGHNNGSWTLLRNWGSKVPRIKDEKNNRMRNVATLSNGRTYALFQHYTLSVKKWEVVELTAADTLRFTGKLFNLQTGITYSQFYPDGSIRRVSRRFMDSTIRWIKQPLTGFDASNNPVWGADSLLGSTPPVTSRDPGFNGNTNKLRSGEITSSNILLTFDGGNYSPGFDCYHVGAVKYGDNKWLWRTALNTTPDYTGPFPVNGDYDIGNNVEYSGSPVMAVDRNIFWGYHGEFWKNSQTNKWNHVYDNGLFVNQFGITGPEVAGKEAQPQMAGNAYCANVVKRNDTVFLYHNDEGHHGGIHRWRITGLNTIQEQVDTISLTVAGQGILASYYNSHDLNNVYHASSRIDTNVHINLTGTNLVDTAHFSASFTGYVLPQYSEKYIFYTNTNQGVRLFVNDSLLINQRNATSPAEYSDTIKLVAGLRYQLRMEVFQSGGTPAATLSWKSNSQPKTQVPFSRLFPASFPDYSGGYNLLENLPYHKVLVNDMYGWTRDSIGEDSTDILRYYWTILTNKKGNSRVAPDLYMMYVQKDVDTNKVMRDLGNVSGISGWQLTGKLSYEKNIPNDDPSNLGPSAAAGGSFMEVLDDQGKVLTRFFWHMLTSSKTTRLYINNKQIVSAPDSDLLPVYSVAQPLTISMSGDSVTAQYGPYAAATTAKMDATAHSDKPKTLRFYFWTKTFKASTRTLNLESMKFSTTTSALRSSGLSQAKLPVDTVAAPVFQVYPNPVQGGVFYIRLLKGNMPELRIRVTDLSGKTVLYKRLSGTTDGYYPVQLNRSVPPGLYIITVNDRYTQKLVIY